MNDEYAAYLQSEAWQKKRMQRLAISRFRCSACTANKAVHVHHLTYERIFDEDMADLLPLCEDHHKAAEELVKRGELLRRGDVLFLATETIRLILRQTSTAKVKKHVVAGMETRNPIQVELMENPAFVGLLGIGNRKKFKRAVKVAISKNSKLIANACVLYDRHLTRQPVESLPVLEIEQKTLVSRQRGFRQPGRKWVPVTEAERHRAFLN